MKNLFERTSSNWVRYSEYEWKTAKNGILYLMPTKTAQPSIYDPLSEYQRLILDAIDIGPHGIAEENTERDTKSNSDLCSQVRFAWPYDGTAYHTELYGL